MKISDVIGVEYVHEHSFDFDFTTEELLGFFGAMPEVKSPPPPDMCSHKCPHGLWFQHLKSEPCEGKRHPHCKACK